MATIFFPDDEGKSWLAASKATLADGDLDEINLLHSSALVEIKSAETVAEPSPAIASSNYDLGGYDSDEDDFEDELNAAFVAASLSQQNVSSPKDEGVFSPNLVGLLGAGALDILPQAVGEWTQQLTKCCAGKALPSFVTSFAKRVSVLESLHASRIQAYKASLLKGEEGDTAAAAESSVPFVVRMSVLSMFPLIESISAIPGEHYEKLCDSTMGILQQVLAPLKPCSLSAEPADCLTSFHSFVLSLIERNGFDLTNPRVSVAVKTLISLSICSGDAGHVLSTAAMLLQAKGDKVALDSNLLSQVARFEEKAQMPILSQESFLGEWVMEGMQTHSVTLPAAVATDGRCLYVHSSSQGLLKFGTGDGLGSVQSVRGHLYESNNSFHREDKSSSLALAGGFLFYFAPVPPEVKQADGKAVAVTAASLSVNSTSSNGKEELRSVELVVLNPSTLKELMTLSLDISSSGNFFPLASDGKHLYVVYQTETPPGGAPGGSGGSSLSGQKVPESKVMVNIYLPQAGEKGETVTLKLVRTVELHTKPSVKDPKPGPGISASHWETGCFFSTGAHFCVLVPLSRTRSRDPFGVVRVFDLPSGTFLGEHVISSQPFGTGVCYDALNNVIRSVCPSNAKCASWINLGRQPGSSTSLPWDIQPGSWSDILQKIPAKELVSGVGPQKVAFALIAHVDRLASLTRGYHRPFLTDISVVPSAVNSYEEDSLGNGMTASFLSSNLAPASSLVGSSNAAARESRCLSLFKLAPSFLALVTSETLDVEFSAFSVATLFKLLSVHASQVEVSRLAVSSEGVAQLVLDILDGVFSAPPAWLGRFGSEQRAMIEKNAAEAYAVCVAVSSTSEQFLKRLVQMLQSPSSKLLLSACLRMIVDRKEMAVGALLLLTDAPVDGTGVPVTNLDLVEKFIVGIVEFAASEKALDESAPLLMSADFQLLIKLQEILFASSKLRRLGSLYAKHALSRSIDLANRALRTNDEKTKNLVLERSFVALVLPSLITTLARASLASDFKFFEEIQEPLLQLMKSLNDLAKSVPEVMAAEVSYLHRVSVEKKEFKSVVESSHPYARGRNQLQQTVTVLGAKSISLHFDPKSRTFNAGSDNLQLYQGSSLSQPCIGPDKNPLVYSGNNWPKQRVVIQGDSVTFLFSAGSRNLDDPSVPLSRKWGFKCTVTESKEMSEGSPGIIKHWLLDLVNSVGVLAARQVSALLTGEPTSPEEQRCQVWLSSRHFTGGRDEGNRASPEFLFLDKLAESSEPHPLYTWLKSKQRRMASPHAVVYLERAERLLLAAMIKHLGLVRDVMEFVEGLRTNNDEAMSSPHVSKLLAIGEETHKTFKWLMERGQLENQWQFAVADRKVDTSDFQDFVPEKLKTLCKMKRVPFSLMNIEDTHRRLMERLRQDIESSEENASGAAPNPHETVCRPIVERARFLLLLLPTQKVVEYPSAVSSNPFSQGSSLSQSQLLEGSRDSQQVELMIEDVGDDEAFANMPLFRSASYFPKTDTAKDQALAKEKNEQKSKEFTRRVKELRQWLDAYSSWKSWRQSVLLDTVRGTGQAPLPRSPIPAISSFVRSDLQVSEMESTLTLHCQRASHRVNGLNFMHQVLGSVSFDSARHQIFAGLRPSLTNGAHYLDRIEACGRRLSLEVEKAFSVLMKDVTGLIGSSSCDLDSRLLASEVCGMRWRCFDAGMISEVGILKSLMSAVVETSAAEQEATGVQPMDTGDDENNGERSSKGKEEENDGSDVQPMDVSPDQDVVSAVLEDAQKDGKVDALRKAVWTSFRLIATQAVNWGRDDIVLNPTAVDGVRRECFFLLAAELRRVAGLPHQNQEDRSHIGELLSLIYMLLSQSSLGLEILTECDVQKDLVLLLQAELTPPDAKRVALRLVRELLPAQSEDVFRSFVSFCFSEIGRWLIGGLSEPSFGNGVAPPAKASLARAEGDESEEKKVESIPPTTPCDLYVLSWSLGANRLFEELFNQMGAEFIANFAGGTANSTPDVIIRRIVDEMQKDGKALLFSGTHDECMKYTKLLAQFGCTLMINPKDEKGEGAGAPADEAVQADSANGKEVKSKAPPKLPAQSIWTSSRCAFSLASQYVSLVRSLASDASHRNWGKMVQDLCESAVRDLAIIDESLSNGKVDVLRRSNVMAALCVVGGFTESLRIGSRVEVAGEIAASKVGTLISFSDASDGTANVVLDKDVSHSIQKMPVASLIAVPECSASPELLPLTSSVLADFLKLFQNPVSDSDVSFSAFLRADMRSRCMQALSSLVKSQSAAELFLHQPQASSGLDALMSLARTCEASWSLAQQEQQAIVGMGQLWDVATKPQQPDELFMGVRTVAQLLPFFPFTGMSHLDILPTCVDTGSADGAVFVGQGYLEFYLESTGKSDGGAGRGRRARPKKGLGLGGAGPAPEKLVYANAAIPESCRQHYFEVEIVNTKVSGGSSSLLSQLGIGIGGGGNNSKEMQISVGLAPIGSKTWGDGSYHYHCDSKRVHFVDGNAQRNSYGHFFRAKSIVGCLWDKDEGCITFTHNGVTLGTAFNNVASGRLVPCIGLSAGVQVCLNFGGKAFRFDPLSLKAGIPAPVEDEETRKKREEENARIEAERAAEEERRRIEEENLYAARKEMAMQIVAIGFPLHHAMRALAAVDYNIEAAVNWALEHEAEPEPEEEPAPAPAAAAAAAAVAAADSVAAAAAAVAAADSVAAPAGDAAGDGNKEPSDKSESKLKVSQEAVEPVVSAEEKYNPKASRNFWTEDGYSYSGAPDAEGGKKSPLSIWEETVLPQVKEFMEAEEFGNVIIEDHLQQIRNAISTGQEGQAKQIVQHIFNGAGSVRFPGEGTGTEGSSSDKVAELTLDEVRIGLPVVLNSVPADADDAILALVGHAGIVRAWDADRNSVLLEFYDGEKGVLREYWSLLSRLVPAESIPSWNSVSAPGGIEAEKFLPKGIRLFHSLASLHARRAVLALLRFSPLRAANAEEFLRLAGDEYLDCTAFHPKDPTIQRSMERLASKLRTHVAALRVSGAGLTPLEDMCERLMTNALEFSSKHTKTFTQFDAAGSDSIDVSIKGARTLLVTFAKSCFLPASSSAKMGFYSNQECTEGLKIFEQGRRLAPFVVQSSDLWFRLQCKAAKRGSCKFSFNVTPCVPSAALSIWLVDFLMQNYGDSGEVNIQRLFDMTLRFFWENSAPTNQKRALADLMSRMVRAGKIQTGKLWEKVFPEVKAMIENDKSILVSSYAQTLLELLVWERVPCMPKVSPEFVGNNPSASVEDLKEAARKDEDLEIAISLAKAMGEKEEEKPTKDEKETVIAGEEESGLSLFGSGVEGMEDMDEDLRLALQMSVANGEKGGENAEGGMQPMALDEGNAVDAPSDANDGSSVAAPPTPPPPPGPEEGGPPQKKQAGGSQSKITQFGVKIVAPPKVEPDPAWLTMMVDLSRVLLVLGGSCRGDRVPYVVGNVSALLEAVLQEPWEASKSERGFECCLLVEAPGLENLKEEEVVNGIYSIAPNLKNLFKNAPVFSGSHFWIEAREPRVSTEILKALNGKTLDIGEAKLVLKATSMNVSRDLSDLLKSNKAQDALLRQYMATRLMRNSQATEQLKATVSLIFSRFSGLPLPENSSLDAQELASVGEPLLFEAHLVSLRAVCNKPDDMKIADAENSILSTYETRTCGSVSALTEAGFQAYVLDYVKRDPLGLWSDLFALGFDWTLRWNSFPVLLEGMQSTLDLWSPSRDAEFVQALEQMCMESGITGPLELHVSQVHKERHEFETSSLLREMSTADLRLRFALLKKFNDLVASGIKYVSFDESRFRDSIGSILSRCRSSIFRQVKMRWTFDVLGATAVEGNQPSIQIQRLQLASKQEEFDGAHSLTPGVEDTTNTSLMVQNTAFGVAMQQLRGVDRALLRQKKPPGTEPHYSLKIVFQGENVEGLGGPYRQFFSDIVNELRDRLPLLIPCPNAQSGVGKNRDRYIVSPSVKSAVALEMYEFLGVLMGCAMRTGVYVNIDLAQFFWKCLARGQNSVNKSDLKEIDKSFYGALEWWRLCAESEWENVHDFTTTLSDKSTVELKPGGTSEVVSYSQRLEWVELALKAHLEEGSLQHKYITRGLHSVIPAALFEIFTEKDLEWRVCGSNIINVELLKKHTEYNLIKEDAPVVQYFWETLRELTQEDLRRFVRFAWGQERLPTDSAEWKRTNSRMLIKPYMRPGNPDLVFPRSDTCFFNLELPNYSSKEVLKQKLITAIYLDADSMDADVREDDQFGGAAVRGLGRAPRRRQNDFGGLGGLSIFGGME